MYCSHCGTKVEDQNLYCPKCGYKLVPSAEAPKEDPPHTEPRSQWKYNSSDSQSRSREHHNLFCGLAYFPILFWLPLVAIPDSAQGRKSANQGLLLLIFSVIQSGLDKLVETLSWQLDFFPINTIFFFLGLAVSVIGIVLFVFVLIGLIKGCQGEYYEIPVIGKITLIS